jgi:TctA family transporter
LLNRFGYPPAPLVLGFILGPMMEVNFKRALLMSRGDLAIFWERPISAALLALIVVLIGLSLHGIWRQHRSAKEAAP